MTKLLSCLLRICLEKTIRYAKHVCFSPLVQNNTHINRYFYVSHRELLMFVHTTVQRIDLSYTTPKTNCTKTIRNSHGRLVTVWCMLVFDLVYVIFCRYIKQPNHVLIIPLITMYSCQEHICFIWYIVWAIHNWNNYSTMDRHVLEYKANTIKGKTISLVWTFPYYSIEKILPWSVAKVKQF